MKNSYTITIKMLSDWHISSGTGRSGNIDSLVKRDHEQFPFIPAKTLTGILRDACEQVALGLDEDNLNGKWYKWVNYLFGNQPAVEFRQNEISEDKPQAAILSIRPARLPERLRNALRNKPLLKEALTFIKPGIAIDPDSGCAKSDFLRFEEMVRSGTKLTAEYTLEGLEADTYEYKTAQSLLAAGASMVQRLGAKRRRGAGKCEITLNFQLREAIAWIEDHRCPKLPKISSNNSSRESKPLASTGNWHRIQLILTARTPLLIHHRTIGNVVQTLDYIPGTFLLAILSNKLRKLGVDIGEAIAQGDIIVTNATLEVNQQAGRPIPLSLFYQKSEKEQKIKVVENRLRKAAEVDSQFKGYRSGYIDNGTTSVLLGTVDKGLETHNTVDDRVQRPNEDVGGVYSYEAIAPGTRLRSELRLRESLVSIIQNSDWKLLKGDYEIGRTKKDDYGLISLEVEYEDMTNSVLTKNGELTIWLLSDVLIRDKQLRPSINICDLADALSEKIGINLKVRSAISENDERMHFIARQNRIDSWQSRWGLPRPSLVGLSAGTCIVCEFDGVIDPQILAELQIIGIGERRAEGYGQICFNAPILDQEKITIDKQSKSQDDPSNNANDNKVLVDDSSDVFCYGRIIEKEAWREAIHKASLFLSDTRDSRQQVMGLVIIRESGKTKIENKPSMSQLGNLRSALKQLQPGNDQTRDDIGNWLKKLKSKRGNKWADGSLDKIENLINNTDKIWGLMIDTWDNLGIDINKIICTNNGKQYLQTELWVEAVRSLIETCIYAHKRDLEQEQLNISKEATNGKSN